jgi:hypothetical protein
MTPGSHWGKLRLGWVFYDPEDPPLRNKLPGLVVAYLLRHVAISRFKANPTLVESTSPSRHPSLRNFGYNSAKAD